MARCVEGTRVVRQFLVSAGVAPRTLSYTTAAGFPRKTW